MQDCLFCKMAAGDIPVSKVYEDDTVLAFHDIDPQAPVHFLVIPKTHIASPGGITPENSAVVAHIFEVIARLALVGLADEPGIAFKIFSLLAKNRINVDIILQSIGRDSSKDISFTVARGDTERAKALLEEHREAIGFREIEVNEQVAKVSIVGAGMVNNPGVAARMFEALYGASVNINMISTSEIKVSVLVNERDADRAVQAIHDRFFNEFGGNA